MKRGDDVKVGPMFPRLHVNDTTEKGGPRAPPRNKMALYEQFSVPFQRFNPNSNSTSSNSIPLTPSSTMTQDLNLKALVLANDINWPLYQNIAEETSIPGCLSEINLSVINKLAGNFMDLREYNIDWFVESCNDTELSKTLFFFVLLQSLVLINSKGDGNFSALFESVFPILKADWESSVNAGDVLLDEFNSEVLVWDCSAFFDDLLYTNLRPLNAKVMVCIFRWLTKLLVSAESSGNLLDDSILIISWLSVRVASMKCIHELLALWRRIEHGYPFLGELLLLLDQRETLILSDKKFLPSLFMSTLESTPGLSCHNILIPQNMENRLRLLMSVFVRKLVAQIPEGRGQDFWILAVMHCWRGYTLYFTHINLVSCVTVKQSFSPSTPLKY